MNYEKGTDKAVETISYLVQELSYRSPLNVEEYMYYTKLKTSFPVCPRCKTTLECEYVKFCDRCGQYLMWPEAKIIRLK